MSKRFFALLLLFASLIAGMLPVVQVAFAASSSAVPQDPVYPANYAKEPRFKALLVYSDTAEPAHVDFARDAIEFFHRLTYGEGWIMDVATSFEG